MCETCPHKIGQCDPRCPLVEEPKAIAKCECCGDEILDFERYYLINDFLHLCRRCVEEDKLSKRELLDSIFELELK